MKNILILTLFFGQVALAKRSIEETLHPTIPCELELANVMVRQNDLAITFDQKVFWKGRPVQLKTHELTFEKNSRLLLRLLLHLTDHAYETVSAEDLFSDAWVSNRKYRRSPREKVIEALQMIRQNFLAIDQDFNALKIIHDPPAGASWDDGHNTETMIEQIPELRLTDYETRWKGQIVSISPAHRRMLRLLVKKPGFPVTNKDLFLAFRGHMTPQLLDEHLVARIVNAELVNIRRAFRAVDSDFDRIGKSHLRSKKWRVENEETGPKSSK
jgi:DNA-binding response OmpR family regulator